MLGALRALYLLSSLSAVVLGSATGACTGRACDAGISDAAALLQGDAGRISQYPGTLIGSHEADSFEDKAEQIIVADALAASQETTDVLSSTAAELEHQFKKMEEEGKRRLQAKTESFRLKLAQQKADNDGLAAGNERSRIATQTLQAENARKRQVAEKLAESNTELRTELKKKSDGMQGVAEHTYTKPTGDAAELQVVRELDEAVVEVHDKEDRKRGAKIIDTYGRGQQAVMLEEQEDPFAEGAEHLIKSLGTNLDELRERQKTNEEELRQRFEANFDIGFARHTMLLKEKESIDTARAQHERIGSRLDTAVGHLAQTHALLEEAHNDVTKYLKDIGANGMPHLKHAGNVQAISDKVWTEADA